MSVNARFVLNVSYPIKFLDYDLDKRIEKIIGRESTGSGGGFGERDMDFEFKRDLAAKNAQDRILKAKIIFLGKQVKITTKIYCYEGN